MVKALRSCLEAARENQGRSLDPQKKPQENSYRIFYSLKYIPYTHSTCRIYSLLVPGILESRMSRIFYSLKYIPYTQLLARRLPVIGKVPLRGRNCPKGWTPFLGHGFLGPFDSGPSKA